MKAISTFLFLLCFALSTAVPYDHHTFASFWGGSSCKLLGCPATETKNINKRFFNIHGLWPDYWSGYPSLCDNSTYYHPKFIDADLQGLLESHWSGLISSTKNFLNHEWTKHGTCWNDVKNSANNIEKMHNYFWLVLDYAMNLDIYGVLESNGIEPREEDYDLKEFERVLDLYWGKGTYILECSNEKKTNKPHLNAVYNCLGLDMEMIQCPGGSSFKACKPGPVYYVPIVTKN